MSEVNVRKRVAVGVFIFLGLAILVVGIFTVGNQHKAFVKTITAKAIFDDIQGLQPGNNVWLSGMKVGTVKKVSFYGNSQVEIILSIEKQAESHIRKDAKAKITTDGLVGNKIVVIYGGTENMPAIADNDVLQTEHLAGMQEMMTTLQASNSNLLEITGNLKAISKKLTDGQGTLGELINDPAIADHLRSSIDHFRAASANSEKMIANLQDFSAGLHRPGGLANELVTDTTVFRQLKGTMNQLNEAANAASEFSASLRTAGQGINDPNTPIGLILHDEGTAADLQRTIKNLRVSSKELSDDLEAVQHNFLLRGFFRKKNKTE
jgi:phospholipid/cholesterol/gamma-HCH transport system substrate-binding protein